MQLILMMIKQNKNIIWYLFLNLNLISVIKGEPEFVMMTASFSASDEKVGIIRNLWF